MHTFFVCSKAMECWENIGMGNLVRDLLLTADNFTNTVFGFFDRLLLHQQPLAAMLLWSIGKSRNTKLWEALETTSTCIISRANDSLQEWSCMQRTKLQVQNQVLTHSWVKPHFGTIKCNTNAAMFDNNSTMGYGMCFRNHLRQLLLGKSGYLHLSASFLEAETIALLKAIKMAISNGFHFVWFETDCKLLADDLSSSTVPNTEFGDLVSQCRILLSTNSDFTVLFVKRQANKVAHSIARASLSHPNPYIFNEVPSTMYSLFMNEMH